MLSFDDAMFLIFLLFKLLQVKQELPTVCVNKPRNENDHYSLGYSVFVVPLVNAVKEQQATIEQQASEIAALKERLQRIEAMLTK
jgi:hypothetical protein